MNDFIETFPMHQSVRPVKVCVVQNDNEKNTKEEIAPSVVSNVVIDLCVVDYRRNKDEISYRSKNERREE
jgi:hypothetical protein